jgi:hypothetical protein
MTDTLTRPYVPLHTEPIGLRAANNWIDRVHRHHQPVTGHKFSVAIVDDIGNLRGVGVAGRPKARALDQQGCIEVVRVATDGVPNAPSMIYAALKKAAIALGYKPWQILTYTLLEEPGTSLHAAGWLLDGITDGGSWDRPNRTRVDKAPIGPKKRWIAGPRPEPIHKQQEADRG